ncbi:unnamed protein product [Durusdinium trenchii]|uniref:Uncharacterized protein n=1 Tax=Durusdinium trenchii TaxID=1381693 RepID=A0ABP0I4H7_9DINO
MWGNMNIQCLVGRQDEDSDAYSDDFAYDDWETEDQETETSQEENAPRHEDDGDRAGESERPADPHDAEDADEDDAYSDDFDANDQETEDPGPEIDHEETRHEDSAVTDEESRMNEESPRGPSVGPAQDAEVRADEEDLDETYSDLFEADPDTEDRRKWSCADFLESRYLGYSV